MYKERCQAQIIDKRIEQPPVTINFPEVILPDKVIQQQINELIRKITDRLVEEQFRIFPDLTLAEMIGTYRVTVNECCILSIYFENFAIFQMAAHGVTLAKAMTVNIKTGQVYNLKDLFRPDSQYRVRLNKIIERQIRDRQIPTIEAFPGITDFQDFYLTEADLVIFFPAGDFTPNFVGIPEFPIPLTTLLDMARPNSPIVKLVGC